MNVKQDRTLGLDIPRALAIIVVVFCHYVYQFEFLGFYGVELFFALSGFLIGGILFDLLRTENSWTFGRMLNFWQRRWWRTLPNYFLFIGVWLGMMALLGKPIPAPRELINFLFFLQNFTDPEIGFYGVSWSLCIEEWFYITFPLVIFLLAKCSIAVERAFVFAALGMAISSILVREYYFQVYSVEEVRVITTARLDAILYGALAVWSVKVSDVVRRRSGWIAICGAVLFVATIGMDFTGDKFLQRLKFVTMPLSCAATLPWLSTVQRLPVFLRLIERPVTSISLWSYSIYLLHMPVLFLCYEALAGLRETTLGNVIVKAVAVLITLIGSSMIFWRFEKPLTRRRPTSI